jgi:TRAP-type mannitol/chloroaromatic compound transport system substrate-binding protein
MEVFDAVSQGTVDAGYGAAYYWKGKISSSVFFTSMQTGVIDALEWVGTYNDQAYGFQKVARYYY